MEIRGKLMPDHIDLFKRNGVSFRHLHHIHIELFRCWTRREQLDYLRIGVFGNSLWVIESLEHCLELVEGAQSQMVGSVDQGVYKRQPWLDLFGFVLIVCKEKSMSS